MAQAHAPKRIFRSSPHQNNKPEVTKKGLLANPGSLIVAALGFLFVGYVFNLGGVQTKLDGFFGGINQNVQGHNAEVSSLFIRALPLVGAAIVVLILIAILRALGPSKRSLAQTEAREVSGIENFVTEAEERGVSRKVSRTAYKQLLPYVRKAKYLGVKDTLCKDLKVTPEQVSTVYGTLLRHTDRRRAHHDDGTKIKTVLDLMLAVEASVDKSAPTSTVRAFKAAAPGPILVEPAPAVAGPVPVAMVLPVAAPVAPVAVPTAVPVAVQEKPKKPGAVMVHPARLARRELSMMRSRAFRKAKASA